MQRAVGGYLRFPDESEQRAWEDMFTGKVCLWGVCWSPKPAGLQQLTFSCARGGVLCPVESKGCVTSDRKQERKLSREEGKQLKLDMCRSVKSRRPRQDDQSLRGLREIWHVTDGQSRGWEANSTQAHHTRHELNDVQLTFPPRNEADRQWTHAYLNRTITMGAALSLKKKKMRPTKPLSTTPAPALDQTHPAILPLFV